MKSFRTVNLVRAQIGAADGIDTTVKSARGWARHFAPTWEMVNGYKQRTLSEAEYIRRYRDILARVPKEVWRALWKEGLEDGEATLLCYCRDGCFCHTHLLIEHAVKQFPQAFTDGRPVRKIAAPDPEPEREQGFTYGGDKRTPLADDLVDQEPIRRTRRQYEAYTAA